MPQRRNAAIRVAGATALRLAPLARGHAAPPPRGVRTTRWRHEALGVLLLSAGRGIFSSPEKIPPPLWAIL